LGDLPADGEILVANGHEETENLDRPCIDLGELRTQKLDKLIEQAIEFGVETPHRMRKQDLVFSIVKHNFRSGIIVKGEGTLEVLPDGFGFLRYPDGSYLSGPGDIYVSPNQIRRLSLRTGDTILGELRVPRDNERYFALNKASLINGSLYSNAKQTTLFENLTPEFPTRQLMLERPIKAEENITGRIIDLFCPIGKGQRGLLVASPKSGKTVIMQHIAHAIEHNHPDVGLMVLLIDERPEEVTEMKRSVRGEVISSTFDEAASRHVQVAEMVIEKAKRQIEHGKDVVILLDSITRLARAYNTIAPTSGRILTGGVDSQALQRPKRFFGAARNIEEGGSLTIIATALIETGSKMDEVIYEEFKGTGNMEMHLSRRIAEKRIYPAVILSKTGTRREERLLSPPAQQMSYILRKFIHDMDEVEAIELIMQRLKDTKSNEEFFGLIKRDPGLRVR
jgi:transcription termination factor Rho